MHVHCARRPYHVAWPGVGGAIVAMAENHGVHHSAPPQEVGWVDVCFQSQRYAAHAFRQSIVEAYDGVTRHASAHHHQVAHGAPANQDAHAPSELARAHAQAHPHTNTEAHDSRTVASSHAPSCVAQTHSCAHAQTDASDYAHAYAPTYDDGDTHHDAFALASAIVVANVHVTNIRAANELAHQLAFALAFEFSAHFELAFNHDAYQLVAYQCIAHVGVPNKQIAQSLAFKRVAQCIAESFSTQHIAQSIARHFAS